MVTASRDGTARLSALAPAGEGSALTGHTGWIDTVGFSNNGTFALTGGRDGTVRVWPLATGTAAASVEVLEGHQGPVVSAAFAPDDRVFATGSQDQTARVWSRPAGGKWSSEVLNGHTKDVVSMVFSSDGTKLVTGALDGTARVWRRSAGGEWGAEVLSHSSSVRIVALDPRGLNIATGAEDGTVRIWSKGSRDWRFEVLEGHKGAVTAISISADGSRMATGGADAALFLWTRSAGGDWSGQRIGGHDAPLQSVAFSPDGTKILTAGDDGTARLWAPAGERWMSEALVGHRGAVELAKFFPGGQRILTVSSMGDGAARVWQRNFTGQWQSVEVTGGDDILAAALSSDGTLLVTSSRPPVGRPRARLRRLGWLGGARPSVGSEQTDPSLGWLATEVCRDRLAGRLPGDARVQAIVTEGDLRAVPMLEVAGVSVGTDVCKRNPGFADRLLSKWLPRSLWSELSNEPPSIADPR